MKKLLIILTPLLSVTAFARDTGNDPAKFITRYELSHEYIDRDGTDYVGATVLRTDYNIKNNYSLRLDLPVITTNYTNDVPADSGTELGNVVTQFIGKLGHHSVGDWSVTHVAGLRMDLDTETGDAGTQDGTIIAPLYASGFVKDEWLVAPIVQWYMGDEEGYEYNGSYIDSRDKISIRLIMAYQPVKKNPKSPISWIKLDPEFFIDNERDEVYGELGVEFGKMVSSTKAIFIKPTFNVYGDYDQQDFKLKIGFRHMFPGKVFFN